MSVASSLAVIGGADPDDPLETENRVRHVVVGAVILLIAAWALVATTLAFHSNLGAPWPVAALGGVLIAGVIVCIDILITVTPFKDDRFRSKLYVIATRGALSLAMGLVISHATILSIYRDDLSRAVSQVNNSDITRITNNTIEQSPQTLIINRATGAINTDNAKITAAAKTLATVKKEEQRRRDVWQADTICVNGQMAANGDRCGDGPVSKKLYNDWTTYRDNDLARAQANHDAAVKAAQKDLDIQNAAVAAATTARQAEVDHAIKNVRDSMGLQAQNNALWDLLKHDWMAWLWPVFFLIVDLVVALLKGILGESDFDRRRRSNRALREMLASALTNPVPAGSSPEFAGLLQYSAANQVTVERARIDRATKRRLEALSRPSRPRASRRSVALMTAVVVLLAFGGLIISRQSKPLESAVAAPTVSASSKPTVIPTAPSEPGSIRVDAAKTTVFNLGGGARLIIPPGAITDGAIVSGSYKGHPSGGWGAQVPSAAPVHLAVAPTNAIRGQLMLEFPAAKGMKQPAGVDAKSAWGISTYNEAKKTWDQVPTSYNPATKVIRAQITHFSWWNPFTWDWGKLWASVVQGFGSLVGTRSGPARCSGGTPSWVQSVDGVSNDANVAIHACAETDSKRANVLEVRIVNNRPYTQILTYGGPVQFGWPGDKASVNDVSYNVLDKSVALGIFTTLDRQRKLLIPAGGEAAVGILPESGRHSVWHIGPTGLTIALDLLAYVLGTASPIIFDEGFGVVACIAAGLFGSEPDLSPRGLRSMLVRAFGCVEAAFNALVGRKKLSKVGAENLKAVFGVIRSASVVAAGLQLVGGTLWRVGDFITDWLRYKDRPEGTGFTVTAKAGSGSQGGNDGNQGGGNQGGGNQGGGNQGGGNQGGGNQGGGNQNGGGTQPLSFTVRGTCTTASGTLIGDSSGFTPSGTFTVAARKPDGSTYPGLITNGRVRADGSAPWTWPCAGDAAGTYTTRVTDNATGRSTGWVAFTIGAVKPEPPEVSHPVKLYDNYGTANQPGIAMCRGNPGRPESMPGGTVAQTFTVGAGVSRIESALVQIDPANVTAHAVLLVNGAQMAAADSQAVGDTHFTFPAVHVKAGDSVTLRITMSATDGKIITVYSAGSPPNSHLTVSNSCSDGARNVDTTTTALRATISGWS